MNFKKNDNVMVIAGKDKGKTGKITQIFPKHNKVVVEGLNLHFRHIRPRKQNEKGQRLEYSGPLDASKVMLLDPRSGKPTRIRVKKMENGDKVRISVKSGEVI